MRFPRLAVALAAAFLLLQPLGTWAQSDQGGVRSEIRALNEHVEAALGAVEAGDLARVERELDEFHEGWERVEDEVRSADPSSYRAIEDAMGAAKAALARQPLDREALRTALVALETANEQFAAGLVAAEGQGGAPEAASGAERLRLAIGLLDGAIAELDEGEPVEAAAILRGFQSAWPQVEGVVAARSVEAYQATEDDLARVQGLLASDPPDAARARSLLVAMRDRLAPFAGSAARYGVWDAALIMLREGFEALLVIGALLTFLKKSGNGDRQRWVWMGGAAGVGASIAVALAAQLAFAALLSGSNRELVEGVAGLLAAAMLVYVSYWLHSKSSVGAWQRYIQERTSLALARNSLLSLALISFLAVFREGVETVLFYVGIAPSIALGDLMLGLGLGTGLLLVVGVLMLVFGVRLPVRPFFLVTGLLLYYLAFKFVGTGLHALQVAGVLPARTAEYLPSLPALGVFPTWETTAIQAVLLLGALAVVLWPRRVGGLGPGGLARA